MEERPSIIIAASGMCEAGRVLHHLRSTIADSRNTVAIVGFQAQHTLGRRLVERRPEVRIFGVMRPRRAEVVVLDGFSAHADQKGLARLRRGRPRSRSAAPGPARSRRAARPAGAARVASPRAAFRRCTRRPRGSGCGCEASQVAHGAHGHRRPPPVRRGRRAPRRAYARAESRPRRVDHLPHGARRPAGTGLRRGCRVALERRDRARVDDAGAWPAARRHGPTDDTIPASRSGADHRR